MREICEFRKDENDDRHHSSRRPSLFTLAARGSALAAVFLIILIFGIPCRSASASVAKDALFVYPGAKKVAWTKETAGSMRVSYLLNMKYPATRVIDWIRGKLRKTGWKPLPYDFLNPNLPRSWDHSHEWFHYLEMEGSSSRMVCMHGWVGDWKDASGDIVTYVFAYARRRNTCSNSGLSKLQVQGIYMPAAAARRLKRELLKLRKHREQLRKKNER